MSIFNMIGASAGGLIEMVGWEKYFHTTFKGLGSTSNSSKYFDIETPKLIVPGDLIYIVQEGMTNKDYTRFGVVLVSTKPSTTATTMNGVFITGQGDIATQNASTSAGYLRLVKNNSSNYDFNYAVRLYVKCHNSNYDLYIYNKPSY